MSADKPSDNPSDQPSNKPADEAAKPKDDSQNASAGDAQEISLDRSDYSSEDLKHLSDLEHVRARPAMYIGDTDVKGLHHLVYEVVDNSMDEAMAGHAKYVSVVRQHRRLSHGRDDGRGIPPADTLNSPSNSAVK